MPGVNFSREARVRFRPSPPNQRSGALLVYRGTKSYRRDFERLDFLDRLDLREDVWRFERGSFFTLIPSWRASESPIAIACLRLLAVPLPRFILRISWRTNSPAWVDAALP